MNFERYNQLESLYLELGKIVDAKDDMDSIISAMVKHTINHDDYISSPLTNDINDLSYLMDTMRFWVLTQMDMEVNGKNFKYERDLYKAKYKVVYWINKVFNRGYDRYIMAQILLGYDCVHYWSLKNEFKFLFKKISDFDKMTRWIIRFIELSEKKGYYNFSSFYAESALTELGNHNILNASTRSTLEKHIRNR